MGYYDLTFKDIKKLASWTTFRPDHLKFPTFQSEFEREWEFWVTKLHGASLSATREDLEVIKNLVNKVG